MQRKDVLPVGVFEPLGIGRSYINPGNPFDVYTETKTEQAGCLKPYIMAKGAYGYAIRDTLAEAQEKFADVSSDSRGGVNCSGIVRLCHKHGRER